MYTMHIYDRHETRSSQTLDFQESQSKDSLDSEITNHWKCTECTTLNPLSEPICKLCEKENPSIRAIWSCDSCLLECRVNTPSCLRCGKPTEVRLMPTNTISQCIQMTQNQRDPQQQL